MRIRLNILIALLPCLVMAQSGINVTGRVSLRTLYTDYDEVSKIKPDSIPDKQYAKTSTIPGLQEALNIALFARTRKLDISFLTF